MLICLCRPQRPIRHISCRQQSNVFWGANASTIGQQAEPQRLHRHRSRSFLATVVVPGSYAVSTTPATGVTRRKSNSSTADVRLAMQTAPSSEASAASAQVTDKAVDCANMAQTTKVKLHSAKLFDEVLPSTRSKTEPNSPDQDTRFWTDRTVLGLGLCPWASQAARSDLIRFVTCEARRPNEVARFVYAEAASLVDVGTPSLSTTLIACPSVVVWRSDFERFETWVTKSPLLDRLERVVALVAFHPIFSRWRDLATAGVTRGGVVLSHFEEEDGERSTRVLPAEVLELDPAVVGVRRVGLRFLDDGVEQWVPQEWIISSVGSGKPLSRGMGTNPALRSRRRRKNGGNVGLPSDEEAPERYLLADNWMHRAPWPTIHLIRRADLDTLQNSIGHCDSLAALQAANSRRMAAAAASGRLPWLATGANSRLDQLGDCE
eukprot:TRINITY_DN54842_c0_g1_i1.p1 TRINITY_DN54842_c0_g1~~TRINITY_DN54842_c0_g1_i1.p1  ORF type:complete len:435 (-),score=49.70 TRINITY_DN54842_c0_g1_i1:173-1477(-)